MDTNIKTNDSFISGLFQNLKNSNAQIPSYQRGYEWGKDQVDIFMDDLFNEINDSNDSTYFLGSIITTYDNQKHIQIIDGQQRLTAATILFSVLRNIANSYKISVGNMTINDYKGSYKESVNNKIQKITDKITDDYIGRNNNDDKYFLNQKGIIHDDFNNIIQEFDDENATNEPFTTFKGANSKGKGQSNNIIRSYNVILNRINYELDYIYKVKDKLDFLNTIFSTFVNKFVVVEIEAPNRSDAFQIFQTINARGMELSASDLIKSDFFGIAQNSINKIQNMWINIEKHLDTLKMSDYIRYFWNSQNDFSSKRYLYRNVSRIYNNEDRIYEFMNELNDLVVTYSNARGKLQYSDSVLENTIINLNSLNFKIYLPVYLSLINKININKVKGKNSLYTNFETIILKVIKACAWIQVKSKVSKSGTNWLEKFFAQCALKITKASNENLNKVILEVIDDINKEGNIRTISDSSVKKILTSGDYFENNLDMARFILRSIENNEKSEKILPVNNSKIHVDHIMPKIPKNYSEWFVNEDTHKKDLWKLGNLAFLLNVRNEALQNKSFEDKKKVYIQSDISTTNNLSSYEVWNHRNIELRTKILVNKFFDIYKY